MRFIVNLKPGPIIREKGRVPGGITDGTGRTALNPEKQKVQHGTDYSYDRG